MTGNALPHRVRLSCTARPLILGIWTSRIKQSGQKEGIASRRSRRSCPELNVSAFMAIDRTSRLSARHTDSSSSTMTISGLELLNDVDLHTSIKTTSKKYTRDCAERTDSSEGENLRILDFG